MANPRSVFKGVGEVEQPLTAVATCLLHRPGQESDPKVTVKKTLGL